MPRLSKIGAAALAAFGWTGGASVSASYLVISGGAGGGSRRGSGGGASQVLTGTASLNPTLSYAVTVGAGGAGGAGGSGNNGSAGTTSTISSFTSSLGVGGGSDGGAAGASGSGFAGGSTGGAPNYGGGGGGGDSAVGANGTTTAGGAGGAGTASSISGTSVTYAGGGGGGTYDGGTAGAGGSGGGGAGGSGANPATVGSPATSNTGSGGGGGGHYSVSGGGAAGGNGGSGVVIISYPAPQQFGGGVVTTSGANVIHTFTTSGTLSPLSSLTASYLVVAGGGGGGTSDGNWITGGGGAGGLLTGSGLILDSNSTYTVTVGAGGAAETNGSNSLFSMVTTTAVGGGRAFRGTPAGSGGSGGGSSNSATTETFGTGTSGQGNNGGSLGSATAGGGGGAGAVGGNGSGSAGGNGGAGTASSISGSSVTYAGGGGGGALSTRSAGTGGSGGGGAGALGNNVTATAGTANTGGGGGGNGQLSGFGTGGTGGAGGSGVVILSYAGATQLMAGGTVTITGGNVIHTFTSSGYLTPIKLVNNSLRFRSSASAYLNRTPATASNRKTWTWSAWVKRGAFGASQVLFDEYSAANDNSVFTIYFDPTNVLVITGYASTWRTTTQVFRDPAAWYHIVTVLDTTQATAGNRVKLYVNGVEVTSFSVTTNPTLNDDLGINQAATHTIGKYANGSIYYFDGYLTEVNFIDGQALTPTSFGTTNSYGVWQPITYGGSYGTNGFYLPFTNTTSATTLAYDFSPNGNNWTPNNISVTAGTTYDSMTDVPTLTSATAANYGVMNPVAMTSNVSATNGNLTTSFTGLANAAIYGTFLLPTSGKWYFESTISTVNTATSQDAGFGIVDATTTLSNISAQTFSNGVIYRNRGDSDSRLVVNGSSVVSGNTYSWSTNDVVQIAYDADSGKVWVGRNNSWFDTSGGTTGNPSSGTNQIGTLTTTINMLPVARAYSNTLVMNWNFGQRPFSYSAPSGFVALNTYNLPASTITNGAAYMAATLWTGNGSSPRVISGLGFQPDFTWIKARSIAYNHRSFDSVRGAGKQLSSNLTSSEVTNDGDGYLSSFDSDGFTLTAGSSSMNVVNKNLETYVGWQWKAGTTSASNTNGSITSTVSAGATQGFSVVTYTGTGANATVGHGLGVAPNLIIVRNRTASAQNWQVYSSVTGATKRLFLDLTDAAQTVSTVWNNTEPTSSVFSIGTVTDVNGNTNNFVAYCFAAVAGYSAVGSYTGNGSADGPFVYTGFRPRFVFLKNSSAVTNWVIWDTSTNPYNLSTQQLFPNTSDAEDNTGSCDILSNGFKLRNTNSTWNGSGNTIIYACFAENPFKYANAR